MNLQRSSSSTCRRLFPIASVAMVIACSNETGTNGPNGSTSDGAAVLQGRLELSEGNQHTSRTRGHAGSSASWTEDVAFVAVLSARADLSANVIATGNLNEDGTFRIEGLAEHADTLIVQARDEGDAVLGQVIVPGGVRANTETTTAPISHETTMEAMVVAALQARGHVLSDIDPIGVAMRTSAEMALAAEAEAQSQSEAAADLASGVWAAQTAELRALAELTGRGTVTARQTLAARLEAWSDLAVALDEAGDREAGWNAWNEFMSEAMAEIESTIGADASQQAAATAAAGFALNANIEATFGTAMHDALVLASLLTGHAEMQAEHAAVTSSEARADLQARIRSSFEAFFDTLRDADDRDDVASARAALIAEINGEGSASLEGASIFDAVIEAEHSGDAVIAIALREAVNGAVDLGARVRADVQGQTDGGAIADAFVRVREDLRAAASAGLGSVTASEASLAFAQELATTTHANGSASFSVEEVLVTLHGDITGTITSLLGLQTGAEGLIDGTLVASAEAVVAEAVRIESGALQVIGSGTVDASTGALTVLDVDAHEVEAVVVRDASGEIVGATLVYADGDALSVPPITTESTVEVQTLLAAAARIQSDASVDRALLCSTIDSAVAGAVAGAVDRQAQIEAMADAVIAAHACYAETLGSTMAEVEATTAAAVDDLQAKLAANAQAAAMAQAELESDVRMRLEMVLGADAALQADAAAAANAALETALRASGRATTELLATVEARSQINTAKAQVHAVYAAMVDANVEASTLSELTSSLDVLIASTLEARSIGEVEAAGAAFKATLIGDGIANVGTEGLLDGSLLPTYVADLQLTSAVATAITTLEGASAELRAELDTIAEAGGTAESIGSAVASAFARFHASVTTEVDLSGTGTVSAGDAEIMTELLAHAYAGLYGG